MLIRIQTHAFHMQSVQPDWGCTGAQGGHMPYRVSLEIPRRQETRRHGWVRQQLPDEFGECLTDSLWIGPDFSLLQTRYQPRKDLVEDSVKQREQPVLAITLGLSGESAYRSRCGKELCFRRGYTTVSTFRCIQGERHYQGHCGVEQLRVLIGAEMLDDYLGSETARKLLLGGKGGVEQLAHHPTTGVSQAHANALLRETQNESPDKLQIHIHALNLLAEQLRHLQLPKRMPRYCQRDIEKLDAARAILESPTDQRLTVSELAVVVGLNECKLREGFRQRFNTSPHRLLLEVKMKKAWQLLETGCQVAEAAYSVGYEHPGNFSAAFSRFFGCAPKSVFGPKC
ncbi:AraC family transcriptional regulator [Verminephrobacter aporrectodeae subsp. tuberculatae]|uniref:helix-turn-helix domain-containing protein n=1 Tax=Verminephrobacter aporrectodeae TaxID=1110389 RepID=UPI002238815A|nr:AraC family transcriptional regulator [Verminephrobacter aporrectodeae]MCW5221499.1 AraC family transcriptional regulator [Verminephrobacter aporrectodeae subsp. tuberculatae]MCW5257813.1 AraC family transcriptional regulator [Verminephrobacter aporrectodeae subsp. tuberculatae]MCW5290790.1 AraC family transcriptional regulator [Verminephrobacter aporrectodeae subsp. tuberculatae]